MKRQRLLVEYEFDFDVFGIVSAFKDYKLAWNLNKFLEIDLARQKDLRLKFINYELSIANYKFKTENSLLMLLKNRSSNSHSGESLFLVPEMVEIDYFITVDTGLREKPVQLLQTLRGIRGIDFALKVDIEKLKSKENFLF